MQIRIQFLIFLCLIIESGLPAGVPFHNFNYCKAKCHKARHVACQDDYSPKPCLIKCSHKHYGYVYPTDEQRETILDKHNYLRNRVASGEEEFGNLKDRKFSNVHILSWKYESEFIASCKVQECNIKHDRCRTLQNGEWCGQNGGWRPRVTREYFAQPGSFNLTMNNWYKEVKKCNECRYDTYPPLDSGHLAVAHFTQFIWAKTTHIGCSYFCYEKDKKPQAVLFCNYCPSGNYKDQAIMKEGDPDPNCGKDKRYPSLCGVQEPLLATIVFSHRNISLLLFFCAILVGTIFVQL